MADPTITTTGNEAQIASDQFNVLNGVTQQAGINLNIFGQKATEAGSSLNSLGTHVNEVGNFFRGTIDMTKEAAASFSLLSVAFLGTSKVFDEFTRQKYDTSGISSIGDELRDVIETASKAANAPMALAGLAANFGASKSSIAGAGGALGKLKDIALEAAKNMVGGADGAFHFQNAIIQLKGSTGELNSVFDAGGTSLQNIDNLLNDQRIAIDNLHGSTGVALPVLAQYYHALGQIPGALQNNIAVGTGATTVMSEFQAAVQLAHGTGMKFENVIANLTTSWELYDLKGEKALEFTSRMSELANNFGIRLSDTSGFLNDMAKSFQFLGENTRGASAIFDQFFGGLRASGLGVKPAIDIIENMTSSIGKMSMAQKAFLSSRTGGPGGLLGAIEIEKDIRAGNIDKVMNQMRQSLMQQFGGRIMTQDQVKTQGDASQFQRQRLLLQSGAFGNLAKDDASATRLLEALASSDKGKGLKTASDLLKQQTDRGASVEDKSNTQLRKIVQVLEDIKQQGSMTGKGFLERSLTSKENPELKRILEGNVAESTRRGSDATQGNLEKNRSLGALGYNNQAFRDLGQGISGMGASVNAIGRTAGSTFMRPATDQEIKKKNDEEYTAKLKEMQELRDYAPINPAQRAQYLKNIKAEEDKVKSEHAKMARPGEAVGRTLATVTRGQQQQQRVNAQQNQAAPNTTTKDKANFTVNVFIDGKKQQSQHTIDMTGGAPSISGN